jgi:hypothetical protein
MSGFFDLHRPTLEAAVTALACREYWTPYPEVPSGKIYGETAKAEGEAAFAALMGRDFALPGHPGQGGQGPRSRPSVRPLRFATPPRPPTS